MSSSFSDAHTRTSSGAHRYLATFYSTDAALATDYTECSQEPFSTTSGRRISHQKMDIYLQKNGIQEPISYIFTPLSSQSVLWKSKKQIPKWVSAFLVHRKGLDTPMFRSVKLSRATLIRVAFNCSSPWVGIKIIRTRKCGSDYSSLVHRKGLEPPTLGTGIRCSIH